MYCTIPNTDLSSDLNIDGQINANIVKKMAHKMMDSCNVLINTFFAVITWSFFSTVENLDDFSLKIKGF